ncbi:hypothetical protein ACEPAF_4765 [Sanghuangporus sanghuang]
MLRQTSRIARVQKTPPARCSGRIATKARAHTHTSSSNTNRARSGSSRVDFRLPLAGLAGSVTAAALVYSYAKVNPVLNEAAPEAPRPKRKAAELASVIWDDEHLLALAWGSNRDGLISPTQPEVEGFRVPTSVPWLKDVALRDLALHERHGVCVDARGDVYQWNTQSKGPSLALSGKDIVSVEAAPSRIFALSSSGKIYVLSSDLQQDAGKQSSGSSWNPLSWGSSEEKKDYVQLEADQRLDWGEKFISISAGNEHLLALTSKGRTFAHPLSKNANSYGQLGIRRVSLPKDSGSGSTDRIAVDLVPKAVADPYANISRTKRIVAPTAEELEEESAPSEPEKPNIRYCDRLYEVPSLKGVRMAQAVAGARSSFVRTEAEGRVLAWGANEYGQLGLGSTVTVDTIVIPTEVVFSKSTSAGTRSQCVDINTGGDLTFFTVERSDGSFMPSTDLLGCGMGQWGGLGNGMYTTAQGQPSRVRAVSGLLEFSENAQNLQPIVPYAISISPAGHVLLTLDTLARAGPGVSAGGGRDLLVWGANREHQLGNGKRASLATPATLELPGLPGGGGPNVDIVKTEDTGGSAVDKGRMMLLKRRAKEVQDLQGRRWKTNVDVEQRAVAGWGSSLVYWKVSQK